ncbi:MAG: bifunctional DNA-formamidopyrimidine glycosylase/DNA-(apurinic or apyrimidinic site) lyase [Acidobacteria bacterium]|nr:bifunctional DNA-formamidopyrimidine glycosylase/DNA-(apurinic or apyrimidinic site) lyase [Acidobacteriota bacterium]
MPELPEVETIVGDLAPKLRGRLVVSVEVVKPLVVKTPLDGLEGRRILHVRRHGKHVVLECDVGVLTVHLGMTGKLLWNGERTPYTRVVFSLDRGELLYDDVRQFGRIQWNVNLPALGPDPLAVTALEFASMVRGRRGRIKPLLLNQRFLRGLGNIYTDEALFRAGIHPRVLAARLSRKRLEALHGAIQGVLRQAIEYRGSSVSDYVDATGQRGEFQRMHQVYGRQGRPCVVCGALIRRIVVGQRGTHYCPRCQRR